MAFSSPVAEALRLANTSQGRTNAKSLPVAQANISALTKDQVLADAAYLKANSPQQADTSAKSRPVFNREAILNNIANSADKTGTQQYVDMLNRLNATNYQTQQAAAPRTFTSPADYSAYYQAKQVAKKKGGAVKSKPASASKRGDGIAQRGKTKGRMV